MYSPTDSTFQYYYRQLDVSCLPSLTLSVIKKHLKAARESSCDAAGFTFNDISTERTGSRLRFSTLQDCFLVNLADGLWELPEGEDAGMLTFAVTHAVNNGRTDVRLSGLAQYILDESLESRYGWSGPSEVDVETADVEARERLFPRETYDQTRAHDPEYDYIRKWWKRGGYNHKH
jgi:hypothetical protein